MEALSFSPKATEEGFICQMKQENSNRKCAGRAMGVGWGKILDQHFVYLFVLIIVWYFAKILGKKLWNFEEVGFKEGVHVFY